MAEKLKHGTEEYEQLNLFELEYQDKIEKRKQEGLYDPKNYQKKYQYMAFTDEYQKIEVCPKCKVKPIISGTKYYRIKCPLCGFECGTYYRNEIVEHWKKCNAPDHRQWHDKRLEEKEREAKKQDV